MQLRIDGIGDPAEAAARAAEGTKKAAQEKPAAGNAPAEAPQESKEAPQAPAGPGGAGGSSDHCKVCGATIQKGATVCAKCGAKVESPSDQLLKALTESDIKSKSTDNRIGTLQALSQLEDQEESEA